jgi:hypothetical protein
MTLLDELLEIIEDGNAPSPGELSPSLNNVDDYYERLVGVILRERADRHHDRRLEALPAKFQRSKKTSFTIAMRSSRKAAGLTLPDLKSLTGLRVARLSDIEKGIVTPTENETSAITNALMDQHPF